MLALEEDDAVQLAALCAALPEARIVLIGAAALGLHVELPRTTADVDLVIALASPAFAAIARELGWSQDPRIPIRFRGPGAFRADVLAVTPADLACGSLEFEGGDRRMSLAGFDLVFAHAAPLALGDSASIAVASLATLVLLKMVAWLDRPDRRKDLADIGAALEGALAPDDERRWDRALALPDDYHAQSAFFLGRSVAEDRKSTRLNSSH